MEYLDRTQIHRSLVHKLLWRLSYEFIHLFTFHCAKGAQLKEFPVY